MTILNVEAGEGNLSLKVFYAAQGGAYRVSQGANAAVVMTGGQSGLISRNASSTKQVMFVRVQLPFNAAGPAVVVFGPGENLGQTSTSIKLSGSAAADFSCQPFFDAVLSPGEQLYALTTTDISLVKSEVWF